MKKSIVVASTIFAATLSTVALADPPAQPTQPAQPAPIPQGAPAPSTSTTPTSTTTTTSSDATAAAPAPTPVSYASSDTTTVYQKTRPNTPLLITGGALFVGTYATTAALVGANPSSDRVTDTMYIPVVGPWVGLAERDCASCSTNTNTLDTVLIAGSGVLQAAGLALVATSFIVPEKVPAATISAGPVKMTFTATSMGKAGSTVGAVGTF